MVIITTGFQPLHLKEKTNERGSQDTDMVFTAVNKRQRQARNKSDGMGCDTLIGAELGIWCDTKHNHAVLGGLSSMCVEIPRDPTHVNAQ